ncbi:MAG: hypothetical protein J6P79_11160 [Pseudobutyrivibrio sp.]|nr:hypothetical protein [Pseudobutyrivibrio sp.]
MFLVIVIVVIVLIVLAYKGVFSKPQPCKHCGKELKGTEQKSFSGISSMRFLYGETEAPVSESFVLCQDCYNKIHPQLRTFAGVEWTYNDYKNYLEWEEQTKEERSLFKPDIEYGEFRSELKIDQERGLFSIGSGKNGGLVLRFEDLIEYDINFEPKEYKEGFLNDKIIGDEYIKITTKVPALLLTNTLYSDAKYKAKVKGILNPKYGFEFSDEFYNIIRIFSICAYLAANKNSSQQTNENNMQNIGELQKALALFMFDDINEVTEEALEQQRNTLIKAFHPDNNTSNEAYSQKINAAYELLHSYIRN